MDIFENDFVDMESIVKAKDVVEEVKSPFKSPTKRSMSPTKTSIIGGNSSLSKEDARRMRREAHKNMMEEIERKEREPPK
jgi:DNA-binding transcriptional regulator GbsR (MarR family)